MSGIGKILMVAGAVLVFLSGASGGQAGVVGLQEAFELALAGNPRLVAVESSLAAGRENAGKARGSLLPKVTLEERYVRTDNPTFAFSSKLNQGRFTAADFDLASLNEPGAIDDFATSLSFEQALYSREASVAVAMARTSSEALEMEYRRAREQVLLEVLQAFISGRTARGHLEVALKGLEDARTHLEVTRSRVDTGLGLESDLLRARVSVSEAEERLLSARKNVTLADRALGLVLGLDGPAQASPEDVPAPDLKELEYYEAAAAGRSDLGAMARRVHNAELNISMATAPFSPTVGLGGAYQLNSHRAPFDQEGDSYHVMAFVRWDLYTGGRKTHAASEARYGLKEAEAAYSGLKKEINYRINEAYLAVLEASGSAELSSSRVSLAEEVARLLDTRYENSLATVVELLDAQTALDAARANLVERNNAYLISLARLMFQSGLVEQEYLAEGLRRK